MICTMILHVIILRATRLFFIMCKLTLLELIWQSKRLFRCWDSTTDRNVELTETSFMYEREGEAESFSSVPQGGGGQGGHKGKGKGKGKDNEVKEVKAKTTDQLAKQVW